MRPALVLLAALGATAPVQCPTRPRAEHAREETPGEALWGLAERFHAEGNEPARRATLQYLVERYPNSRFAQRARDELAIPDERPAR